MTRLTRLLWLVPFIASLGVGGCDDTTCGTGDLDPPAAPRGLTSLTGDEEVILSWYANGERDLEGYRIYRNDRPTGRYERIGWVGGNRSPEFSDRGVTNGTTYYYAISAVDFSGNESDLSPEEVFDTPRPEGWGLTLRSYDDDIDRCALDFSRYRTNMVTSYENPDADIAYVYDDASGAWMFGLEDPPDSGLYTEIQDAGYQTSIDHVGWAPPDGWSASASAELTPGHVYVIWTRDDHYGKFRVLELRSDRIVIDWAYQTSPGNQELREAHGDISAEAPRAPRAPARSRAAAIAIGGAGNPGSR